MIRMEMMLLTLLAAAQEAKKRLVSDAKTEDNLFNRHACNSDCVMIMTQQLLLCSRDAQTFCTKQRTLSCLACKKKEDSRG